MENVGACFRYLIHTRELSLTYRGKENGVGAYSDASLADCKGAITTCSYLVRLFGNVIGWKTQKQHYVALSTCLAENVAMSEACKEMIAGSYSLEKFACINIYPMTLQCDNNAAILSTQIQGSVGLRHLTEIRFHFVKECVRRERVKIVWVASKDQLADIFTKPLSFSVHEKSTNKMSNVNLNVFADYPVETYTAEIEENNVEHQQRPYEPPVHPYSFVQDGITYHANGWDVWYEDQEGNHFYWNREMEAYEYYAEE